MGEKSSNPVRGAATWKLSVRYAAFNDRTEKLRRRKQPCTTRRCRRRSDARLHGPAPHAARVQACGRARHCGESDAGVTAADSITPPSEGTGLRQPRAQGPACVSAAFGTASSSEPPASGTQARSTPTASNTETPGARIPAARPPAPPARAQRRVRTPDPRAAGGTGSPPRAPPAPALALALAPARRARARRPSSRPRRPPASP